MLEEHLKLTAHIHRWTSSVLMEFQVSVASKRNTTGFTAGEWKEITDMGKQRQI